MKISHLGIMVLLFSASGGRGGGLTDMFRNWDPNWPQRFGITGVGYAQQQNYGVGNAEIMLGPINVPATAIGEIENEVTQFGVKADAWILPFWNVHAILGTIDGTTTVTPALPGFPTVEVNYDGVVYGVGTTLAYGRDWWWASVTGVITETDLDTGAASVMSWLVTPKVGVKGERFEAWIGATYQNVDERQKGTFDLGALGMATYDIELEAAHEWNAHLGLRYSVSDSIFLTLEGGFGNRESVLWHVEWRFW